MTTTFADTAYYLALLNARDEFHRAAKEVSALLQGRMVTTTWVLTEVADAFCRPGQRDVAAGFVRDLQNDPRVNVVPPTIDLFNRGLELYSNRPDKEWSLTDCISFVVMKDHELTDVLATDRDFQQAGFRLLLPA